MVSVIGLQMGLTVDAVSDCSPRAVTPNGARTAACNSADLQRLRKYGVTPNGARTATCNLADLQRLPVTGSQEGGYLRICGDRGGATVKHAWCLRVLVRVTELTPKTFSGRRLCLSEAKRGQSTNRRPRKGNRDDDRHAPAY
jgi:hypothetical protein